jgi:hypothetical protein
MIEKEIRPPQTAVSSSASEFHFIILHDLGLLVIA